MKNNLLVKIFFLTIISLNYNNLTAQAIDVTTLQGPFKIDLFQNGKIYFEKSSDINKPINFILEYQQDGKNIKYIVDKYEVNGGDPEIVSVFFDKIHNKKCIFTIIKWRDYHRALQINGYDYQIYAYTINKFNKLALYKKIVDNPNLSGIDGEYYGKEVFFKYKTAADVKKYLRYKYH